MHFLVILLNHTLDLFHGSFQDLIYLLDSEPILNQVQHKVQNDGSGSMKSIQDEWGHDPSVQSMRRVFSYMEKAQQELLGRSNISFFDKRLRSIREKALELFEQVWPLAVRKGMITSEKDAAPFYVHCLARALGSAGVEVPEELLPGDEKMIHFLKETLP